MNNMNGTIRGLIYPMCYQAAHNSITFRYSDNYSLQPRQLAKQQNYNGMKIPSLRYINHRIMDV
jgi:hypothetical protein